MKNDSSANKHADILELSQEAATALEKSNPFLKGITATCVLLGYWRIIDKTGMTS